ncbi:three-Cys-motif partner protein TcmP, partial [Nostoc favosum]
MSEQLPLFTDLPKIENAIIEFGEIRSPVWTANKAQLVAKYLFYFVMITKHGAYIDGFAAPKDRQNLKGWAADLVLNQEPKFLKEFYLCDIKREGVRILEKLKADHPPRPKRHIEVHHGDFNARVYDILKSDRLKESTATFCLLDQFSFECHWSTVKALAAHKKSGNKIELFYFLCTGWLNRGLKAFKKLEKPEHWWGNADWKSLTAMTS